MTAATHTPKMDTSSYTILVADDDETICTILSKALTQQGHTVKIAHNGRDLLQWAAQGVGDLVITDVIMPEMGGLDALSSLQKMRPELPVIVISAQSTLMTAVEATQRGATEYFPKPFDLHALTQCVNQLLPKDCPPEIPQVDLAYTDDDLIGTSAAMQHVFCAMARLTQVDLSVLIIGESGTGKEMIARKLHQLSTRCHGPFVALNMAAIPHELVEHELFGHADYKGSFAQAEGGVLFLDEIGDIPFAAQATLLRVLQEGEYTPVGSYETVRTNVRIICSTHQNLEQKCADGSFRDDLFYRLNVVPLHIPPLRERVEDIVPLANFFLVKSKEKGIGNKNLDSNSELVLESYCWPGNVRELENFIYRSAALSGDDKMSASFIASQIPEPHVPSDNPLHQGFDFSSSFCGIIEQNLHSYFTTHQPALPPPGMYGRIIRMVEKPLLRHALHATRGNQLKAAELLGINRNTLRKKISDLDINTNSKDYLRDVL